MNTSQNSTAAAEAQKLFDKMSLEERNHFVRWASLGPRELGPFADPAVFEELEILCRVWFRTYYTPGPKTFADLKVGDRVWGHRTGGHDFYKGPPRIEPLTTGELKKKAGGWFVFRIAGSNKKSRTRIENEVHDDACTRFIGGEHSTSYYVYSNERAAILGTWADHVRNEIGADVGNKMRRKCTPEQLYQIAKILGYEVLPELPEEA